MMKHLVAALAAICLVSAARAQAVPPYVYTQVIGTTSVQVLPLNPNRKKVIFHNGNATAMIAVCPIGPTRTNPFTGELIVAVINGPGCITILPYDSKEVSGGTPSGPQQQMGSAWVGIASAANSAFTALEFE